MNTAVTLKSRFQRTVGVFLAMGILTAAGTGFGQYANDRFAPEPDQYVYALALQPDGKILAGGSFENIGGAARRSVARVLSNGRLDTTFTPGDIPDSIVEAIAIQADGKIIIGGEFSEVAGQTRYNLARLNADGSLDADFNPNTVATEADKSVVALAIQPDGKIIAGGFFVNLGGQMRSFIGRLNADGSLDTAFNPAANGEVNAIVIQPDGKILVGGDFSLIGGANRRRVARLNADGSLDATFTQTNGASDTVTCLKIQADGKILIGGNFETAGGQARARIARLNSDGSLDTTFNPLGQNSSIHTLAVQADGKIIVGGNFTILSGGARTRIGRLNMDGSLDTTFESPGGALDTVYAVQVQTDGKAVAAGGFTTLGGVARNYIGRLYPDGRTESCFNPESDAPVYAFAVQADSNILIGGQFKTLHGILNNRLYIARLYNDDALDAAFDPGADNGVWALHPQPDGKIIVGGQFTTLAGSGRNGIGRLNADGTLEAAFNPNAQGTVHAIALQADGKIMIGGSFTKIGGVDRNYIARLNADGSLDTAFNPNVNQPVYGLAIQADGKIIIGGIFTQVGDITRNHIARFNADGSLDTAFDPNVNDFLYSLQVQADGKIIIYGEFTKTGDLDRNYIARLNADGTPDTMFDAKLNSVIYSLAIQTDGKIIIGGSFTKVGDVDRVRIARLNHDGSLDTTFNLADGAMDTIHSLALQTDGKLLVSGNFLKIGGENIRRIARIANTDAALQSLAISNNGATVTWTRTGTSPEIWRTTFEQSINGSTWTSLGAGARITNGWQITGVALPVKQMFYIRARGYGINSCVGNSGSLYESVRLCYLPNGIEGDFDRDGMADPYVVDTQGNWHIFFSGNGWQSSGAIPVGQAGWQAVAADFDADGKADPAMVDADGNWYFWFSGNGWQRSDAIAFGQAGTPVAGDFDKDGQADPAMVDANGNWYFWFSGNGWQPSGAIALGQAGWKPVVGDFDGDNKADPAMVANNYWIVRFSGDGFAPSGPILLSP